MLFSFKPPVRPKLLSTLILTYAPVDGFLDVLCSSQLIFFSFLFLFISHRLQFVSFDLMGSKQNVCQFLFSSQKFGRRETSHFYYELSRTLALDLSYCYTIHRNSCGIFRPQYYDAIKSHIFFQVHFLNCFLIDQNSFYNFER